MRWRKLSDNYSIDIDSVIFTEWRHWVATEQAGKALDVYLSSGKSISIPEKDGEMLLNIIDNEVRRENVDNIEG